MTVTNSNPTQIDWARLAAFIDGEGCIGSYGTGKNRAGGYRTQNVRVIICNCDARLMTWLKEKFGGCVSQSKPTSGKTGVIWSAQFRWYLTGKSAASVLVGCLPYFVMKRDQAELGIAIQKLTRSPGGMGPGSKLSDSIVEERNRISNELSGLKGLASRNRSPKRQERMTIQ